MQQHKKGIRNDIIRYNNNRAKVKKETYRNEAILRQECSNTAPAYNF